MRVSGGSKVVGVARADAEEEASDEDIDDIDALDTDEPVYDERPADNISDDAADGIRDDIDDIDNLDNADPAGAEDEEI